MEATELDYAALMRDKRAMRRRLKEQTGLRPLNVAILGASTVGDLKTLWELFLLRHGFEPTFREGQYGRYYEEALFPDDALTAFKPDILYLHTTSRDVDFSDPAAYGKRLAEVREALLARHSAVLILNNFEMLPYRVFGNADVHRDGGRLRELNRLNEDLYEAARRHERVQVNDIQYLAALAGLDAWWNEDQWHLYKYAIGLDALPSVAWNLTRLVMSLHGQDKKGLALDLDNTLWGGVVGDDGVEGIVLGDESPRGRAFGEFQEYLRALRGRGVALAVCSKNEESAAREGLGHPSSRLAPDDFSAFAANWRPKPENLADIADGLNLGVDSLVFVDDNPAEREAVARALPQVMVVDASDPMAARRAIDRSGAFEGARLTGEDTRRAAYYRQEKARAESAAGFVDYGDYLRGLEMRCTLGALSAANAARVAQLINKTNQFNPTTRRYAEVDSLIGRDDVFAPVARLGDKFGDSGLVTALVARRDGARVDIEAWVMSCRVFRRDLEYVFFDHFVVECRRAGVERIHAEYIPTAKNKPVAELYPSLGFDLTEETPEGTMRYSLDCVSYRPKSMDCMEVVYDGAG